MQAWLWYLCRYGTGRVEEVQELIDTIPSDILSKVRYQYTVMNVPLDTKVVFTLTAVHKIR